MKKLMLMLAIGMMAPSVISAPNAYFIMFGCTDPHGAGRHTGLAETLIQHLIDDCTNCYGTLMTNSSISSICKDVGFQKMTNASMIPKLKQVAKVGKNTYYLIEVDTAIYGVMGKD